MRWSKAYQYMKEGKCKGVTRLDIPSTMYITLYKYTYSYYKSTTGLTSVNSKLQPEDIVMQMNDCIDGVGQWINLGQWNDDKWLLCKRVYEEDEIES